MLQAGNKPTNPSCPEKCHVKVRKYHVRFAVRVCRQEGG